MSDLTQAQFAAALLRRLHIKQTSGALRGVIGWENAEGGNWHNDAKYNPLNTTQPMAGAGNTGSQGNIKVYKNWAQGLDATVKTLQNGRYDGILGALKQGNAGAVADAIGRTPWGTNGALVQRTIAGTRAPVGVSAPSVGAPTSTASSVTIAEPEVNTRFDRAGYDHARRAAVVGNLLAKRNPTSGLIRLGVVAPGQVPSREDFTTTDISTRNTTIKTAGDAAPSAAGGGEAGAAVTAAVKRLGVGESGANNRGARIDKWEQKYGMLGQPWCGIFVGLTLEHAGVKGITSRVASVDAIEQDARAGRNGFSSWHSAKDARVGDALVTAKGQHVGLVTAIDSDGTIHTIEGNTSTGRVARRTHSADQVYGVARPSYR